MCRFESNLIPVAWPQPVRQLDRARNRPANEGKKRVLRNSQRTPLKTPDRRRSPSINLNLLARAVAPVQLLQSVCFEALWLSRSPNRLGPASVYRWTVLIGLLTAGLISAQRLCTYTPKITLYQIIFPLLYSKKDLIHSSEISLSSFSLLAARCAHKTVNTTL